LKRVFNIEIETCSECGGDVSIIASIEDPVVIQKILTHLDNATGSAAVALLPDCVLHRACRPGYLTEDVNSTMTAVHIWVMA